MDYVMKILGDSIVQERSLSPILQCLSRVALVWRILVEQIGISEKMTPQDFMGFRRYLESGSGFQSLQVLQR